MKWNSAAARRLRTLAGGVSVEQAVPAVVDRLLEGVACPPTDLEAVCAELNVAGIDDDDDAPVVGELRREGSAFRIVCAAGQSPVRRRFTVAHELAHVLFESTGPRAPKVGADLERLCDMLAAEILMPTKVFELAIGDRAVDAAMIRDLAARFQTSLSATAIRCSDFRPISVLDVHHGRVRWRKGSARPTFQQVDELLRQTREGEAGDGIIVVMRRGHLIPYSSEWIRVSGGNSGLLLLRPAMHPAS